MVILLEKAKRKAVHSLPVKLHIGLCQRDMNIESLLKESLSRCDVVIHPFDNIGDLYEQNQRSYIDIVVFAGSSNPSWVLPLVREMKAHSILQFIPILVHSPGSSR